MSNLLFSYVGPDTMLPVASALAVVFGALLVCWRFVVGAAARCVRFVLRRDEPDSVVAASAANAGKEQSH
jgi:hypothetical protein